MLASIKGPGNIEPNEGSRMTSKEFFKQMSKYLDKNKMEANLDASEENLCDLIEDQFKNFGKKSPRYHTSTFELAYLIHAKAPSAYRALRGKNLLRLPHPNHLIKVARGFNLLPNKKEQNLAYLKTLCEKLKPQERIVCLEADEVHLKKMMRLRNGRLCGFADNVPKPATTCFAMYINNIFGHFGEVADIVPVADLTSRDVEKYIDRTVRTLQEIGFTVVAISLDNNRVNQGFYNIKKASSTSPYWYANSQISTDAKIFMIFDSLHVWKNLRNNWLAGEFSKKNKKPPKLSFPDWDNYDTVHTADFEDIRDIYKDTMQDYDENRQVLHVNFTLTAQALWPNSFDRQKEGLVRQIFNEKVAAELHERGKVGTAKYVEIVTKWEHLMNSKNLLAGKRSRVTEKEPYTSAEDPKLEILQKFSEWLARWQSKSCAVADGPTKKLSKDTFEAIRQTTAAMILLVKYLFEECDLEPET